MAFDQAKKHAPAIGLPPPPKSILTTSPVRTSRESLLLFTVTLSAVSHGYFLTQYAYTERFYPVTVDFDALKRAIADTYEVDLGAILPKRLDYLLSLELDSHWQYIAQHLPDLQKRMDVSSKKADAVRLAITSSLTLGSLVWQAADSLSNDRRRQQIDADRVFMSYSSKDRKKVQLIARSLEQKGLLVWMDEKDIVVGEPILDRIRDGILKEVNYILVFLSEHSIASEWVRHEIRLAYQREMETGSIVVLPILLRDCSVPDDLRVKKYLDARGSSKQAAENIVNAINNHRKVWNRPRLGGTGESG